MPTGAQELADIARGPSNAPLDAPSIEAIAQGLKAYRRSAAPSLGPLKLVIDGKARPFYQAIADPKVPFARVEVALEAAPPASDWVFLRPFSRILLAGDGSAEVHPPSGPKERVIARWLPREGWRHPGHRPSGRLPTPSGLPTAIREGGFLPFGAALEIYASEERWRYEIDLLDGRLLADPRAGRYPKAARVRWPSRAAWSLDRLIARSNLAPDDARLLEAVAEIEPGARSDLGGPTQPGRDVQGLERLAARHLVEADPATGRWQIVPEALGGGTRAPAPRRAPAPARGLQESVRGLLAEADARATCPMCGDAFAPGGHGLLCDRCQREVLGAPSS